MVREWWPHAVAAAVAVALYVNTLGHDFVYDDNRAILSNDDVVGNTPLWNILVHDFWGTPLRHAGSHGSYRPLTVLSFRLTWWASNAASSGSDSAPDGGGDGGGQARARADDAPADLARGETPPPTPPAWAFHAGNVALHAAASAALVAAARRLCAGTPAALAAGVLFAAHPAPSEAVAGVVGRADLAGGLLALLSLLAYCSHASMCARTDNKATAAVSSSSSTLAPSTGSAVNSRRQAIVSSGCTTRSGSRGTVSPTSSGASSESSNSGLNSNQGTPFSAGSSINISGPRRLPCAASALGSSTCAAASRTGEMLGLGEEGSTNPKSGATSSSASASSPASPLANELGGRCVRTASQNEVSVRERRGLAWAVALAGAAMLAKETGVMALPLCAAYEVLYAPVAPVRLMKALMRRKATPGGGKAISKARELQCRRIRSSLQCLAASFCAAVALRALAVGGRLPEFATADNPAAKSDSLLTRTLTFSFLPAFNFGVLLFPATLSFDWSMDSVPLVCSLSDARNIASLAFYCALVFLFTRHLRILNRTRDEEVLSVFVDVNSNHQICNGRTTWGSPKKVLRTSVVVPVLGSCCPFTATKRRTALLVHQKEEDVEVTKGHPLRRDVRADPSRVVLMSLAMMVLPFLPATNLVAYVGFVVAERLLYVPAMGYCLLMGHGFGLLWERALGLWRRGGACARVAPASVIVAAAVVLAALAARTLQRCADWRDEESLYRSGLTINPPKAYGNLGNVLSMKGKVEEAEHCYRMALKHRPNMADVHYNLGILLQNTQRWQEAITSYQAAIRFRPHLAAAHLNLGLALQRAGRGEEALAALRACAALDGARTKDPRAHELARAACRFQLGRLAMDAGRPRDALRAFQDAVAAMPPHYQPQSLYNLLGEAHSRLGHDTEAERWYRAALSSKPDHVPAHLTYGRLLARNASRLQEAERWYRRAEALAPEDAAVFRHYGQFLLSQRRPAEAVPKLLRALELTQPETPLYEDAVNAATALRLAGDLPAAEEHYRLAVRLRPQEASGLANLGALYHLRGRLEEAEQCYERALELQPGDAVTEANLRRLRRLQAAANTAPASATTPAPPPTPPPPHARPASRTD